MLLDLRVSADRAVWHPPHTGGKPRLFQEPRRNPERDGLSAGGRWIRTSGSAPDKGSGPRFRFGPELMATDDGGMQPKPAIFALSRACMRRSAPQWSRSRRPLT